MSLDTLRLKFEYIEEKLDDPLMRDVVGGKTTYVEQLEKMYGVKFPESEERVFPLAPKLDGEPDLADTTSWREDLREYPESNLGWDIMELSLPEEPAHDDVAVSILPRVGDTRMDVRIVRRRDPLVRLGVVASGFAPGVALAYLGMHIAGFPPDYNYNDVVPRGFVRPMIGLAAGAVSFGWSLALVDDLMFKAHAALVLAGLDDAKKLRMCYNAAVQADEVVGQYREFRAGYEMPR